MGAPETKSRFKTANDFNWAIPETERIKDETKIHVRQLPSNTGLIDRCMERIRQLFRMDELDNIDERLEAVYK